ncbi:metallophosphoesterase [Microcoleus sp. FACHB-68]|uniref:metallophosphoesterase family protein n=1 Tax=Microcoleus sp. FACHB-68 TaxID=2692826 RepID=UPI0016866B8F|nr:metallophosphoesterase [Microcoleus sp. FACHB-68]MBD1940180.1 metallophosphoesterase [Microcoleus sp. FACHB-68]
MNLNFRFAVVSDPHIGLPHTIWDHPSRFHLVEVSIPALEIVFNHLAKLDLDFLLLPGDLTQHGEPENHAWLSDRLAQLPFPVYVVPGNHDVPQLLPNERSIGLADFPSYYLRQGYDNPQQLYYTREILPGVRLISLNSNQFDGEGKQLPFGRLDDEQIAWLKEVLSAADEPVVMVMVHHNVVEHLPGQSRHSLGRRYMLENAPALLELLRQAGAQLVFTGHLHVQDVAENHGIYDITTGSLVSYPHPYRVLQFKMDGEGKKQLQIETHRVDAVPDMPALPQQSREWMGERSYPFMMRLLTEAPLNLPPAQAEPLVASLRYFWADIAMGDAIFDFSDFPSPVRRYFEAFSATDSIDNHATLML